MRIWKLEKALRDKVFDSIELLCIVHSVILSCGMKNSLIADKITAPIRQMGNDREDESMLIEACAMAGKNANATMLDDLNTAVNNQGTSAGNAQMLERREDIILPDSINTSSIGDMNPVNDYEENSNSDSVQSVAPSEYMGCSDNAQLLSQSDTEVLPLGVTSSVNEDIVSDDTKDDGVHEATRDNAQLLEKCYDMDPLARPKTSSEIEIEAVNDTKMSAIYESTENDRLVDSKMNAANDTEMSAIHCEYCVDIDIIDTRKKSGSVSITMVSIFQIQQKTDVMAPSTSSPFGAKYGSIVRALCLLSKDQRIDILQKSASGLIKCICKCALNISDGNIPLNDYEKKELRKYAGILRKLIILRGTWNNKRVVIIRRIAESFPTLLLPVFKYFSERECIFSIVEHARKMVLVPEAMVKNIQPTKNSQIQQESASRRLGMCHPAVGKQEFANFLQKSTIPREFIGNTSLLNDGSDAPLMNLKRNYGRISRHLSDSAVTPGNLADPTQGGDEEESDDVEGCREVCNETADSKLRYSTPGTEEEKSS
ncbi:hypothetical protein QAD02_003162 [Eretmocerus hayati]|uniref:Uncharacterized protein n=1 Tax=Eretmocerus hayati TaxID=131215 RepID=A0ACC2NL23_9HYME|nr:hypothetical protein QAD02_003162 [Eretmocerus hayati]